MDEGIGIELDDGVKRRAALIDGGDAVEIGLSECVCGEAARGHALLQIGDGGFFQFESRAARPALAARAAEFIRVRRVRSMVKGL